MPTYHIVIKGSNERYEISYYDETKLARLIEKIEGEGKEWYFEVR